MNRERSPVSLDLGDNSPKVRSWGRLVNVRVQQPDTENDPLGIEKLPSAGQVAEIYEVPKARLAVNSDLVYVRPPRSATRHFNHGEGFSRVESNGSTSSANRFVNKEP